MPTRSPCRPVCGLLMIIGLVFATGCGPSPRLIYPTTVDAPPEELRNAVAELKVDDRIRLQTAGKEPLEAVFAGQEEEWIEIRPLLYEYKLTSREEFVSSVVKHVALKDIRQLHVYRTSTLQAIGLVAACLGIFFAFGYAAPK